MRGDTKDKIEKQNIKKTDILKKKIIKLKNQDKEINLIEDKKLKNLIFEITDWGRIDKYKNEIFTLIEDYLGYANNAKEAEWKCYLENAASMNWKINIADFALNRAFSNAKQNNKLDNLSELAHTHLLSCYKQYYSDLIPQIDAKDDQLEAIIQISSLIQKLNNKSNVDTDIYKRFEIYPRSIGNLDEKDLFKTPIRGVGSPHGMCITIYHKQGQKMPVMLQAAGTTGDPVLNRRHYISLFSAALTSNKDPRFVLPYSSCFAIGDNIPQTESENMLQAVIGPNGLEEPKKGVPTINMNPDEAMIMLGDLMSKAQADTGLVQIIHMDIDNALIFEQKIIQALEANQESVLSCMDNESASTGVIHHLPYYILKNNKAIPIEINIPFSVLNHERIFLLLKATRNAQMRELKLDGDRRLKFAKNAYEEQDRAIKKWNNYKEQEKINQCHMHPFVKVSRFYDFELGIIRNINPPRDIERREYEEKHRPPIKDQAFRMMEKMKNICKKIDDMNKEGGIADILALKWLISSVIRRETPFIDSKQFQELYSGWQKSAFVAIWASIETWALKNDFPLKLLAQDNIVYNLRLNKLFNNITLLPCIAVDLNDYTASIIKRNGKLILQIEPANITPAIENCFGGDMKLGINSLSTLHESFCTWMKTNFSLTEGLDKQIAKEKTSLLPPPVSLVQAVVLLEIAQAKLFNSGDTDATGELIKQIQRFDKGIIYFIGAITEQFQTMRIIEQKWHSLEELNANGMPDLIEHNQTRDINGMINNTIGQIIQHFRNIHLEKIKIDEIINHRALENQLDLTNQIRPELIIKAFDEIKTIPINKAIPLSSRAETYIAQLIDKEPEFIPLLYLLRDVNTLKKWSLKLSPDQEKQVIATLNGIIGLEFLEIAEGLETGASNLDLDETSLNRIDNSLSDIYAKLHNTTFEKPSCTEEIIEAINFVTKKIKTK